MIKIIAIDLDGTLLDSQSRISENNKKSIKKCIEKGLKVAIIIGQNLHYAKKIIDDLGLASPMFSRTEH
jgi:5-amino-6-(5-phospho-D-ribitylamino)uracil phosphatase